MKSIAIFSGKGGVGKTSFSILLASWLSYHMKERVFAYDFESPEQRMMNKRKADLHTLEAKSSLLAKMCEGLEPYPIGAIRPAANGYTSQELDVIERNFRKAKASGDGYIICDFPGRFGAQEAVYRLSAAGLIDLMAFPVVPEEQSVQSMFIINKFLSNPKFYLVPDYRQQVMCFWNMVTRNDSGKRSKTDIMGQYEKLFAMLHIPVSPTRIRFVDTMKRSSGQSFFVTTTVCYPRAFVARAFPPLDNADVPYIENLFQEMKDRLDGIIKPEPYKP